MDTFFCSDLHLKHKNILKFQSNRIFSSVEEHDETLITNWNSVVQPQDNIWFLGDFSFGSQDTSFDFLSRLNGHIFFIIGNHDTKTIKNINFQNQLSFLGYYHELKGFHKLPIILSHYPFSSWNRSFHGSWSFHGHCHGTSEKIENRIDVGIDCHTEFRPFHIDELIT